MRTIKFRIWNKKTKAWIHGPHKESCLDGVNLFGENILFGCLLNGVSIKDLNEIVALQFTGLTDKDGREIFEGDILYGETNDTAFNALTCQFEPEYGGFSFCYSLGPRQDFKYWYKQLSNLKVVGNIFENPELCAK